MVENWEQLQAALPDSDAARADFLEALANLGLDRGARGPSIRPPL